MDDVSRETLLGLLDPEVDPSGVDAYAKILQTIGVERGLLGPREAPRLWDRHLLNSAVVVVPTPGLVPLGSSVIDVGTGAGLPGLVWALIRPDLTVTLVEPLLRRSTFLTETVTALGLSDRVTVIRDRSENLTGKVRADIVTARAVAPLAKLLAWTLPLVKPGGRVLALKGQSAEAEVERSRAIIKRLASGPATVVTCGEDFTDSPTRVIIVPA